MGVLEQQFRVFKSVADTGNITQASKLLHMSQPSISVQIQHLEREYNARLLDRTNKGVSLTKCGTILYNYACQVLDLLQEASEAVGEATECKHGSVHLGATLTIGEYILPHIINKFNSDYPGIDFNAKIANTEILALDLVGKRIHVVLVEGPVPENWNLDVEPFWHDELAVVVAASHPWASRDSVTFDELKTEKMIIRERGSGTRKVMELALEKAGFGAAELNIYMELGGTQAIKQVVEAGMGVTIISALTVQQECQMGRLKTLSIDGCQLSRPLSMVTVSKAPLTKDEMEFAEFMRDTESLEQILSAALELEGE